MDKQIIEIANEDLSLSLFRGFLQVENKKNAHKTQIPLDNILSIIISAHDAIISKNIISTICENGGSLIICGRNYLPSSITVPYIGHWLISPRIKNQINSSLPLKKNLWKSIIQHKIINQAQILNHFFPNHPDVVRLNKLSKETLSDDARNNEAIAAKIYFKSLFGKKFIRDRKAENINILLNYSYTILRAMVARAIASNGLLPYLGIKHCTQSNTLPLVDDLIEPFRALADKAVFETINTLVNTDNIELTPEIKRKLTSILSVPVKTIKGKVNLSDGIIDFVGSLVESYEDGKPKLKFPELIFDKDNDLSD